MTDSDGSTDRMRERAEGNTLVLYLLLEADRQLLAAAVSLALFAVLVAAGTLHPTPAETLLTRGDSVETLFQALTAGLITAVTLVLTLSQLILSQELGAVGDQRERMEGSMSFRSDVADAIDREVSPAEPSAFLGALVATTADQARAALDELDGPASETERLRDYLRGLAADADDVAARLEGTEFGSFGVLHAALDYDYSRKLHTGRWFRANEGETLSSEARDALARLTNTLALYGPAREHVKTLYFQWALAELSRWVLYLAMPALAVTIGSLLFLDPQDLLGVTAGVPDALLVVSAAVTLSVVPFTLLLTWILRIVTVTKRTLAIGPFLLRRTDRTSEFD
jgi:hypothetical protein